MTENHPIRPPHELVQQWVSLACENEGYETWQDLATQAARWGADQELLACGNYLEKCAAWEPEDVTELYNYRRPRPKPPSLKEQAMKALDEAVYMADDIPPEGISPDQADIIRRALEALPE